jgi:3-deoxy-manno-octulosonate cytidylyltransferase (CMP-KDO synthetase)
VVKVVADQDGYALYFSRAPIPYDRAQGSSRLEAQGSRQEQLPTAYSLQPTAYKHIGLYGYQRHFLLQFPHLAPTPLEQFEQLEQLRALEHGYKIKVLETPHDTIGVDTPDDLAKVEALLAKSSGPLNLER